MESDKRYDCVSSLKVLFLVLLTILLVTIPASNNLSSCFQTSINMVNYYYFRFSGKNYEKVSFQRNVET